MPAEIAEIIAILSHGEKSYIYTTKKQLNKEEAIIDMRIHATNLRRSIGTRQIQPDLKWSTEAARILSILINTWELQINFIILILAMGRVVLLVLLEVIHEAILDGSCTNLG